MFNVDSYFTIGSDHRVCEDYAIHGDAPFPYFILSDGCSSSSNTDFGSRLLVMAAKNLFHMYPIETLRTMSEKEIGIAIISLATTYIRPIGLNSSSLDATLLIGYIDEDKGSVRVLMYGDGSCIFSVADEVTRKTISYESEAPFYLNYQTNINRLNAYKKDADLAVTIDTFVNNQKPISDVVSFDEPISFCFPLADLQWLVLASDGIQTTFNKSRVKIEEAEEIASMFAFKGMHGEFAVRRMKRWKKNNAKNGLDHSDDISVAGFSVENEVQNS